jgi:IgGFc binding protein
MNPIFKVLLFAAVFASLSFGFAQSAVATEFDDMVLALEETTPLPASDAPTSGNFYTIQHGEAWPPLPGDTMDLPFWDLGGGFYLLDDTNVDYDALQAEAASAHLHRVDDGFSPDFSPMSFTTNDLWLQITGVTNGIASLVIHPPSGVTNGVYDLEYTTNLAGTISWQWLLRTDPGQTNLAVPNATDMQGYYRLGPPNDLVANDSLGTNFWLAFPDMLSDGYNVLSLYISSPFTTSGTMTIQNQSNGPSLLVTGSGDDPSVNGTYYLTNISVNPANYGGNSSQVLAGAPVTNAYVNGSLVIFFDDNATDQMGWALADTNSMLVLYAGPFGVHNFNNVIWGYVNEDPDIYPGTAISSCAEFPLIQSFSVTNSNVTMVPIPNDVMINGYDAIAGSNSINVTANAPLSVYAINYDRALSAAFTAFPTTLLGTNYCVIARPASLAPEIAGTGYSQFAIVATEDYTTVVITPSATADLSGTVLYTNTLQKGETYQIRSIGNTDDVTGTLIASDKPIAVFAGASDAFVPDANTSADNPLVQEQIPVNDWGTQALALSFAGRSNGASYRILAANNGTVISITGKVVTVVGEISPPWTVTTSNETVVVTNNAGQFYDIGVDGPVEFLANRPIQVAQFANGTELDLQKGDPSEILLPPTDHYLETNTVVTLPSSGTGDFAENYMNLIVAQSAITNTLVDGSHVSTTNFVAIGTSGYSGVQIVLTNSGAHTVTSSQPVGVEVYGWGNDDAYGYSGGIVK